jgi:hypothetical protein
LETKAMNLPRLFRHAIAALAAGLLTTTATQGMAHASFDGHVSRADFVIEGPGLGFLTLAGVDVTGGSAGSTISLSPSVAWNVSADGDMVYLRYTGSGDFMYDRSFALQGFRLWDKYDELPDILAVQVTNTTYVPNQRGNLIEGFLPAQNLWHDADNVYVDLGNSMYHHHSMGSMGDPNRDLIALRVSFAQTPPIPEPGSWVLFGTGLLALGWGVRRSRRLA